MTKYFRTLSFTLLAMSVCLTACNDDDDKVDYTEYYDWRDLNTAYTLGCNNDIRDNKRNLYFTDTIPSLTEPYVYSKTLYRVLKSANEDSLRKVHRWITPLYNSTCKVHYTLYDPKSVMDYLEKTDAIYNSDKRNDQALLDKIFFDSPVKADTLESSQVTFSEFAPSTVIKGWGDALQQMHIGDSWLICVPWFLGYGQKGSSSIDPYSNLFFRIELVDITKWGGNIDESDK